MTRRHIAATLVLCVSAALAGDKDANVPALAKGKKLHSASIDKLNPQLLPMLAGVVLSPDGRQLLYTVPAEAPEIDDRDNHLNLGLVQKVNFRLRDLKTGKERKLPLKSLPRMATLFMSISRPFSPDSSRIALTQTIKFDVTRFPKDMVMTVRVYDIAKGKMHDTGLEGTYALGTLSPDGKKLMAAVTESTGVMNSQPDLMVGKVGSTEMKEHSLGGVPAAFCPKGEVVAIIQPPIQPQVPPDAPRTASRMLLHDFKTGKTAELPLGKDAMEAGPSGVVWTRNGKYFAYSDWEKYVKNPGPNQQEHERQMTRLWDREKGKLVADLPDLRPVAPGPTESSIFCRKTQGKKRDLGRGIYLYDHATRKTTQLGKDKYILLSAGGDRVVYGVKNGNSLDIYLAEIKMPPKRK